MTPSQKSITASLLLALALGQLVSIALARGWIGSSGINRRRRATQWHHAGGYLSLAIVVTVAYFCTKLLPDSIKTTRVLLHTMLGISVVSLGLGKLTLSRFFPRRYAWLPVVGALLFICVAALWISAAGWYFFWFSTAAPGLPAGY